MPFLFIKVYIFSVDKIYLSPDTSVKRLKLMANHATFEPIYIEHFQSIQQPYIFFLMSGLLLKQWPTELTVTGGLDHLRLNFYGMHRTQITSDVIESN